jgi:hypothetical protein
MPTPCASSVYLLTCLRPVCVLRVCVLCEQVMCAVLSSWALIQFIYACVGLARHNRSSDVWQSEFEFDSQGLSICRLLLHLYLVFIRTMPPHITPYAPRTAHRAPGAHNITHSLTHDSLRGAVCCVRRA